MEDTNERGRNAAPSLSGVSGSLVREARNRRNRGDIPSAGDSIERALRIEPNNPLLWLDLAHLRLTEGSYGQAEGLARKAASLSNGAENLDASAWRVVGESLRQRGRDAEAQEAETLADQLNKKSDPVSSSATKSSHDATIRATITAVARSQPARIGIEYGPDGNDFAVRIGSNEPVQITRSEAQALLGGEALRNLDTTLQADRSLADPTLDLLNQGDLGRLNEGILRQRFIAISTQTSLAQAALVKLATQAGSSDINTLTPAQAMKMITGLPGTSIALPEASARPLAEIYDRLKVAIEDGSPVTLRTKEEYRGAKQDTLIDNHTYSVTGVKLENRNGKETYELTLRNPWGNYMRVDLQTLIKSGGLDSFTMGASRLQQRDPTEIRRADARALEQTRRTLAEALTQGVDVESANPQAAAQREPARILIYQNTKKGVDGRGEELFSDAAPAGLPAGEYVVRRAVPVQPGQSYRGLVVHSSSLPGTDDKLLYLQKNSNAGVGQGRECVTVRVGDDVVPQEGRLVKLTVDDQGRAEKVVDITLAELRQDVRQARTAKL